MIRARNLRAAANFIPAKSFRARKAYYNNEVRIVSLSVFYYYYYFDKKKKKNLSSLYFDIFICFFEGFKVSIA